VSRGLLDGSLPSGGAALERALEALLQRIDGLIAALPPHAHSELSQLLALLASAGGRRALTGLSDPWPVASVADIQQALHDIVGSAYFSDSQTWGLLGYPGPLRI
jgi:hypothetical protein